MRDVHTFYNVFTILGANKGDREIATMNHGKLYCKAAEILGLGFTILNIKVLESALVSVMQMLPA